MIGSKKWLAGVGACVGLGLAAAVYAAPGTPEQGGQGSTAGEHQHGMQSGMHGQMANATPEQRRQIGQARHAQMHGAAQSGEHRHGQAQGKGPRGHGHGDSTGGQSHQH